MPDLTGPLIALVFAAGAAAGGLGATLGLGGGVFLVPLLNAALHFPLNVASGAGLLTVVATSCVVGRETERSGLVNLRLGMLLQVAAAIGGYGGGRYARQIPEPALQLMFAAVTAAIAGLMLSRLERRNILDATADPGRFGGRFFELESGRQVVYQVRRLPLAFAVSLAAGSVSGLLGVGGGILQVPALNAWCGVPLRAAAATSAMMIGVTAAASAPLYYARGDILPPLAAAAVLGTFLGSRAGLRFGIRARARWLKILMACVLLCVSALYLVKGLT